MGARGDRHGSVDQSAPTIMWPEFKSQAHHLRFAFYNLNCYVKRTKISKKGPGLEQIFPKKTIVVQHENHFCHFKRKDDKIKEKEKYLKEEICLKAVNEVKICGNHVSRDSEISYERNVLERITTLEKILNAWKRRHLSINGKMIIIKCFALSQITFVSQFSNIKTKDIKKIEGLCYKFILW